MSLAVKEEAVLEITDKLDVRKANYTTLIYMNKIQFNFKWINSSEVYYNVQYHKRFLHTVGFYIVEFAPSGITFDWSLEELTDWSSWPS